jgi:colanic acid/amylovoran biosynthesis protein
MTHKTQLTVGLLWHSLTSDNLGVGALTESQIAIANSAAAQVGVSLKFIIFGTTGGKHYYPKGIDICAGSRISIKQMLKGNSPFLKELDQCDLVLDIGEGDSFADIYGLKRFLFLMVSKYAVLAKGKPLILSPQTIGPFDKWYTRLAARHVMRKANKVYARDGLSAAYLQSMGVTASEEVIDVAFRLPFTQDAGPKSKMKVGINVSGLLFSGGYEGGNQFGLTVNYPKHIRDLITRLLADSEKEVWLVPHVMPDDIPNDDDRVAIKSLLSEFPGLNVAPEFASPSAAKSFISGLDFLTGARMHACIGAFSAGVPVVPFAYSRKFNGLFNTLSYPWFVDGKKDTTEQALEKVLNGIENLAALQKGVINGNVTAKKRLNVYETGLKEALKTVAKAHAV